MTSLLCAATHCCGAALLLPHQLIIHTQSIPGLEILRLQSSYREPIYSFSGKPPHRNYRRNHAEDPRASIRLCQRASNTTTVMHRGARGNGTGSICNLCNFQTEPIIKSSTWADESIHWAFQRSFVPRSRIIARLPDWRPSQQVRIRIQ